MTTVHTMDLSMFDSSERVLGMMTSETTFLNTLRELVGDRERDALYPCIQDLVANGPVLARFSIGEPRPQRQDITQYLAAWCRHVGLTEEATRRWLAEYCVVILSPISKTSISGIRHSTISNVKYIYRSQKPFVCECENNHFKAQCSHQCPVHADMQTALSERGQRAQGAVYEVKRPVAVTQPSCPPISIKTIYAQQLRTAQEVIRSELAKGATRAQIVRILNERGLKSRTGRNWTYGIFQGELVQLKRVSKCKPHSEVETGLPTGHEA